MGFSKPKRHIDEYHSLLKKHETSARRMNPVFQGFKGQIRNLKKGKGR